MLTSHEAVSWYLDGVRTHVSLAGPPVVAVRVEDDGDALYVAANEAERLAAEELLADDAARIVTVPWWTPPAVAAAAAGGAIEEAAVAASLRAARASLLPRERERYRALGREAAEAMTDAAGSLSPATSEHGAAAALAAALVERGIEPLVVLVAGRSRLVHRHPLPTEAPLGDRAMLVACGRRHGLIANLTRWVGESGGDDERILAVEAAFLAASRPGEKLSDVFAAGCAGYGAQGFAMDEWTRHHQGGPTGYAGRDPRATAETDDVIASHQAFAWNPSAPGAKVEDTVIVGDDGVEVLTTDPRWPAVAHAGLLRPTALAFS
ncbi:M24 family metallopeptidase [Microbacterium sp. Sa4CUA7]|uniref:M24 family metallopeptidase n=1 Tax=Microbacterium pullorum TaxID=2762236 RepID=A0ABR8S2E6_9MICO|nr:M24 family metallopeptidase [Microbacterium pullorum]